jgi:endonuclease/exonuclease/phosphatase family metal-dependent hydrolase
VLKQGSLLIFLWLAVFSGRAENISITTLNCYAFFGGGEAHLDLGQPKSTPEYWAKAQNLVNLWPANPPLVVALQEIGGPREAVYLSQFAARRYQHTFQPVFGETKDTFTEEAVGAMIDLSQGWRIKGKPGRVKALDKFLSKHLFLSLTNGHTTLDFCIVHLRRPIRDDGIAAQQRQCLALKNWAADRLKKRPSANLIILGDFNEAKNPGDAAAALAPLVAPAGELQDTFVLTGGKFRTHADGSTYDRILISDALATGRAGLKFSDVAVTRHEHGKGEEKKLFTDHFPVTATFERTRKK